MNIFRLAWELLLIYLLYKLIVNFIIPVYRSTKQIRVMLDDDEGITIEKCTAVNRAIYKFIEESGFYEDGNFSLEVSSPGIDKPLKLLRQYQKNKGRKVEVLLKDGTKTEGLLTQATDTGITIEQQSGKGKKMAVDLKTISFDQIKHTTVQITF